MAHQRGRLLLAMAEAVGAVGYAAATVADVLARARVSRATFYEHFANKEDCFAAAFEAAADVLAGQVMAAAAPASSAGFRDALRAGLRAYCAALDGDPLVARALMLEVQAAGAKIRARRAGNFAAWAEQLETLARRAAEEEPAAWIVPADAGIAAVGAVIHVLGVALEEGRDLPGLADALADTTHRILMVPRGDR